VRLLDQRVGIAENPGQQSADRLQNDQHGHLAAEEHIVTE
jgi:hypothetical protein